MDNPTRPENKEANNHITSDTAEIVRRHLEDKNHEITDEEIRNIRVVGEDNEPVTIGAEAKARLVEKKESSETKEEDNLPGENDAPVTPWDVVK